jgi:hypothetical protein
MITREIALFAGNVLVVRKERHLSQSEVNERSDIHVTEVSRMSVACAICASPRSSASPAPWR